MESKHWTGDDERDSLNAEQPDAPFVHYPEGECDCHCDRCGAELGLDPIYGVVYVTCGDCYGGAEPDGEAFRGGEAAAYEREQQAEIQRTLK